MSRWRVGIILVLLLELVLVSSCAASVREDGPLETGVDELGSVLFGMCPATETFSRAIGAAHVVNTDPVREVIIDSVELLEADGVVLRDSYLIPLDSDSESFGGGFRLPPSIGEASEEQVRLWDQRVPLEGATLPPLARANLLLGVADELEGSKTVMGAEVRYRVGNQRYRAVSGVGGEFVSPDDSACKE